MPNEIIQKRLLPDQEYQEISLAPFTSWGIGGIAARVYSPSNITDLQLYLRTLSPNTPLLWLGLGSNVLISDQGFPGVVIMTTALSELITHPDGSIEAAAGVTCGRLARRCIQTHHAGSFFAGIPGSIGGALAMNAGAYGGETWTHVRSVHYLTETRLIETRPKSQFDISYRTVKSPVPGWFLGAIFDFPFDPREPPVLHQEIRALLQTFLVIHLWTFLLDKKLLSLSFI